MAGCLLSGQALDKLGHSSQYGAHEDEATTAVSCTVLELQSSARELLQPKDAVT